MVVTKILANGLAPHLDRLVAANQSAFIRGRSIYDDYMLVQQTIKLIHRRKVSSLFLKLDISEAFDSISWPFLLEILTQPGEEIRHQRGLRQGDPLSPMLLVLIIDVLNNLLKKASDLGLLQPLAGRNSEQRISLYADDVAPFIRPEENDMNLSLAVLEQFGVASGLHTNLQMSCAIPIRCEEQDIERIDHTLPCTLSEFPTTYLGLPISDKKLRRSNLLPWIEKIGD